MSDIRKLQKKVIDFRDERNWKQFHNPKDMAISLTLEAAEVLEHFQFKSDTEIKRHLKNNKDEVSEELADVLYWVLLMANDLQIDLNSAFDIKMTKNSMKYPIDKSLDNHIKYTELN